MQTFLVGENCQALLEWFSPTKKGNALALQLCICKGERKGKPKVILTLPLAVRIDAVNPET